MKVTDLARTIAPEAALEFVGIRPGEKLHEQMIGEEDSFYTYEYPEHYKILPAINNWASCANRIKDGKKVPLEVKVGDRVLVGKYSGSEVKLDGKEYLILREDEVLGVVE